MKHWCYVHKEAKVGVLLSRTFDNEGKGVLYGSMALWYGGAFPGFKNGIERFIRAYAAFSNKAPASGPTPEDGAHRDTVYKHCLDREDEDTLHDVKATDVAFANLARELWNGRLYKQLSEHWNDRQGHTRDDSLDDADG